MDAACYFRPAICRTRSDAVSHIGHEIQGVRNRLFRWQGLHEARRRIQLAARAQSPRRYSGDANICRPALIRRVFNPPHGTSGRPEAFFLAWSPKSNVLIDYIWKQVDFPWLGIWKENRSRAGPFWNGNTITRGMEFGVSPMPETRRQMIERGSLFSIPGYQWVPAGQTILVNYRAFVTARKRSPKNRPPNPLGAGLIRHAPPGRVWRKMKLS
jgi:hypothetical protein